jgi:energy-coupling factor transporter ATP-binding protein EcfA2
MTDVRFTRITFEDFKALRALRFSLDRMNILVGPNNSGKSTVLAAFRVLEIGIRRARSRKPERIGPHIGYLLQANALPISLENVHTEYEEKDSTVTFDLSNGNSLELRFPREGGCILVPRAGDRSIRGPGAFKSLFPVMPTVVPVLGPVEHKEKLREKDTVIANLSSHRASQNFRSYWYHFPEGFDAFAGLISSSWSGMEVQRPEVADKFAQELAMFCLEDRLTRELYWSGFGFQIWCQLITHISRGNNSTIIVIDEPEIYLHPDVQRRLISILRGANADVLLATHSTEIMAEADPSEIILIDKQRNAARRLRDIVQVQQALDAIGSIQNITLTALARNRRVLFVEGANDYVIIRRFARRIGLVDLANGVGLTDLKSGGFGSWNRVTTLAGGVAEALGTSLRIAAVYDRDYFSDQEIASVRKRLEDNIVFAHIHQRKEIENYLLVPDAVERAIERAVRERASRMGQNTPEVTGVRDCLESITNDLRDECLSQYIARRAAFNRSSGIDNAGITRDVLVWFNSMWSTLESRLEIVAGKETLKRLRDWTHDVHSVNLTDARIVDAMHRDEIPSDLVNMLLSIDEFRLSS